MTTTDPITTLVARRIPPGMEEQYEAWVKRIIAVGSTYKGHLGVNVIRPSVATNGIYLLVVRFDTRENQQRWANSEDRHNLLQELNDLSLGETSFESATGLETWFTLPEGEQPLPPPNRHKITLVIAVVVFVLVLLINLLFKPLLAQLDLVPRVAFLSFLQVGLLTYVIMPWVTRLLKFWLYPAQRNTDQFHTSTSGKKRSGGNQR